jgi:hypothetical protein
VDETAFIANITNKKHFPYLKPPQQAAYLPVKPFSVATFRCNKFTALHFTGDVLSKESDLVVRIGSLFNVADSFTGRPGYLVDANSLGYNRLTMNSIENGS